MNKFLPLCNTFLPEYLTNDDVIIIVVRLLFFFLIVFLVFVYVNLIHDALEIGLENDKCLKDVVYHVLIANYFSYFYRLKILLFNLI